MQSRDMTVWLYCITTYNTFNTDTMCVQIMDKSDLSFIKMWNFSFYSSPNFLYTYENKVVFSSFTDETHS